MYMTKYEVFCTVFENWISNITILTTENCTGAIKTIVFSSSMSIAQATGRYLKDTMCVAYIKYRHFQNGGYDSQNGAKIDEEGNFNCRLIMLRKFL